MPKTRPKKEVSRRRVKRPTDLAILGGPTEDGKGTHVLRVREDSISAGEVRPVREGAPINDRELVRLRPVAQTPRVCEVEVLHDDQHGNAGRTHTGGPAQVATASYRKNWSQVFKPTKARKRKPDYSLN